MPSSGQKSVPAEIASKQGFNPYSATAVRTLHTYMPFLGRQSKVVGSEPTRVAGRLWVAAQARSEIICGTGTGMFYKEQRSSQKAGLLLRRAKGGLPGRTALARTGVIKAG